MAHVAGAADPVRELASTLPGPPCGRGTERSIMWLRRWPRPTPLSSRSSPRVWPACWPVRCSSATCPTSPSRTRPVTSPLPETVKEAVLFIHRHIAEDIGIQTQVAAAVHLTPRAVQYLFRRQLDTTPTEYMRRVRPSRAHHELMTATSPAVDCHRNRAAVEVRAHRPVRGPLSADLRPKPAHHSQATDFTVLIADRWFNHSVDAAAGSRHGVHWRGRRSPCPDCQRPQPHPPDTAARRSVAAAAPIVQAAARRVKGIGAERIWVTVQFEVRTSVSEILSPKSRRATGSALVSRSVGVRRFHESPAVAAVERQHDGAPIARQGEPLRPQPAFGPDVLVESVVHLPCSLIDAKQALGQRPETQGRHGPGMPHRAAADQRRSHRISARPGER